MVRRGTAPCACLLPRSYAILTTKLPKRAAILAIGAVAMILYIRRFMQRMAHAQLDV